MSLSHHSNHPPSLPDVALPLDHAHLNTALAVATKATLMSDYRTDPPLHVRITEVRYKFPCCTIVSRTEDRVSPEGDAMGLWPDSAATLSPVRVTCTVHPVTSPPCCAGDGDCSVPPSEVANAPLPTVPAPVPSLPDPSLPVPLPPSAIVSPAAAVMQTVAPAALHLPPSLLALRDSETSTPTDSESRPLKRARAEVPPNNMPLVREVALQMNGVPAARGVPHTVRANNTMVVVPREIKTSIPRLALLLCTVDPVQLACVYGNDSAARYAVSCG